MASTSAGQVASLVLPKAAKYAMAACCVVSPTLFLVADLLFQVQPGDEGEDFIRQFAANMTSYSHASWLYPLATLTWVPALLVASRVARANAPSLGLVGMILAFGSAIPMGLGYRDLSYILLARDFDIETVVVLLADAKQLPSGYLMAIWTLGLVGLFLLGWSISIGKSGPKWAGWTLAFAALSLPLSWYLASKVALSIGYVVLAIALIGCARSIFDAVTDGHDASQTTSSRRVGQV